MIFLHGKIARAKRRRLKSLSRAGILCASVVILLSGCGKKTTSTVSTGAKSPTVASLVPAATDLLIGMGASDHLVAVSNFDEDREGTHGLPRVGDYENTDWEQIAQLHPAYLIHQAQPDRLPPGLVQRAKDLNIQLLNIQIERVNDIYTAMQTLGNAVNEKSKADAAVAKLRAQLDAVQKSVEGKPKVRTLIVRDETGLAVIGRDTFLDDVLTIAGGDNVIEPGTHRYPNIDPEMLMKLAPDAVIQLLPEASAQMLQEADKFWKTVPDLPAVKNGRVYVMTDWFVEQPGPQIGKLAEMFAAKLHPQGAP
jgi:cobalamin transport system substrate-binding protein